MTSYWNTRLELLERTCGYAGQWTPKIVLVPWTDDEGAEVDAPNGGFLDDLDFWKFDALIRDHATEWLGTRKLKLLEEVGGISIFFTVETQWGFRMDFEPGFQGCYFKTRDEAIEAALRWCLEQAERKPT